MVSARGASRPRLWSLRAIVDNYDVKKFKPRYNMQAIALRLRSRCDIAVRSDEARAMTGCGKAESGPTPSQRI